MDVVPTGDGWDTEPFKLTEQDGKLIGRGTSGDAHAQYDHITNQRINESFQCVLVLLCDFAAKRDPAIQSATIIMSSTMINSL